jgi:hypothetical protein
MLVPAFLPGRRYSHEGCTNISLKVNGVYCDASTRWFDRHPMDRTFGAFHSSAHTYRLRIFKERTLESVEKAGCGERI